MAREAVALEREEGRPSAEWGASLLFSTSIAAGW
jgi:hypothetical protein